MSRGRPGGRARDRRRRQNAALATGALVGVVVAWVEVDSWLARVAVVVLVTLAAPAVATLLYDRRR